MKLWSRGLGRTEIYMDFRYYTAKSEPETENVMVIGKMNDPVNWEFKITFGSEDIPGLTKIFFNYCVIKLVIKNLYKYVIYLFNRRKYAEAAGRDLEEKVDAAYIEMMNGRLGRRKLTAQ